MNVKHQLILALLSAVYNTALYHFNKNTKEKTRKVQASTFTDGPLRAHGEV